MATGLTKNTTVIGIESESTEGTYVAPSAATSYIAPLESGFELTPGKELVERKLITSTIGQVKPRVGLQSVTATLPVELRGSGTEGAETDFDLLIKGALGARRQISTTTTTKSSGNTATILQIQDADISKFSVGDMIIVKESAAYAPNFITAVDTSSGTANITVAPGRASSTYPNSVVVSKCTTYYPANSGHIPLSLSFYWGNEIRETAIGCKVTQMSVDNFQTGQLASLNFSVAGLSFDQVNGSAPHTPSFDTGGVPPLILRACLYQNSVAIDINKFSISLANELKFITSTCSASGKTSSRVTSRKITGSINPYKDDTSVAQFTKFNANTDYSLIVFAYNPSSTTGEIDMGSCVGFYLPACITTELKVGDQEGILVDDISFQAHGGSAGTSNDIYMGFV